MPRIEDFKVKLKEFKPIKYTPWDNSPASKTDEILSKMVEPLYNNQSHLKNDLPETKTLVQNKFKTSSKQVQNALDISSDCDSKEVQNGFKTSSETGFKLGSKSSVPAESGLRSDLSFLTGAQKTIFYYLVDNSYIDNCVILVDINTTELSKLLNIPKDTVKTSIRRLQEKLLIKKKISKQGVGGFLRFEISEETKFKCLEMQKQGLLNLFKTGSKTGFTSHVVSSNINNTTTTYEGSLPLDWESIDYSSLEHVGFGKSHLIQIYREFIKKPNLTLSTDIIQDSINALAFDLKYNNIANSFKNSPIVVLTLLLKKGQPYSSKTPEKFLTPQEEAMQEYLLAQEKKQQRIVDTELRTKNLALQEWMDLLSEDELLDFNQEPRPEGIPDKIYQISKRKKAIEFAKDYFNTVVWPKKRKEIIEGLK